MLLVTKNWATPPEFHACLQRPTCRFLIVLPWTVAFPWTERAARFGHRNILAFYTGTENSCSRKLLHEMFRNSFDEDMRRWTAGGAGGGSNSGDFRVPRSIVFPPSFRLL